MFMKQITKLEFDETVNLKFCKNCYPNPIPAPRNVNLNFYKRNILHVYFKSDLCV